MSGKVYTAKQLEEVKIGLEKKIKLLQKEHTITSNFVVSYRKYAKRAMLLQNKAKRTLSELNANIENIKMKCDELEMMKEQVELARFISDDVTVNYESILQDVNKSMQNVESKIYANQEFLNEYMNEIPSEDNLKDRLKDF